MEGFAMKLSAPIPVLKQRAKAQGRELNIPHLQALNSIARQEGFPNWDLLAAKAGQQPGGLFDQCAAGDLVLLGARPGQGKTLLGLQVLIDAVARGHPGFFFTFEYTTAQVIERLRTMGIAPQSLDPDFNVDTSDKISAAYIIDETLDTARPACIVIDYLQLLDQRRDTPPLHDQVRALRDHASARGHVIILISQIDRRFDGSAGSMPDIDDVRLPNPIDLGLFSKTCFLHEGEIVIS
jgi:replicative DNA helicase